jgi:hypothetical protein
MMILKPIMHNTIVCLGAISLFACEVSIENMDLTASSNISDVSECSINQFLEGGVCIDEETVTVDPIADVGDTSVDLRLSWIDNSDNETEYIIKRRLSSEVDYGITYYLDENTITYDDTDVSTGETYCYRISASNSMGEAPSSEVCINT